jgi:predicted permease
METFFRDLKHSLRMFRQTPGFTAAAVAALALGIGANTAIFSVVNTVLLKPLPFPDPDRIVNFLTTSPTGSFDGGSVPRFMVWREQTGAVQDSAAYRFGVMNLTGGDSPEQLSSGYVTADFFRLFGAQMASGRTFTPDEDRPNGGKVVVLSHGFWQRRFGGDPGVVGRTIPLGGDPHVVVGVLARSFDASQFEASPDVWTPFQMDPAITDQAHYFTAAARLKPGVSMAMANTQMQAAAEQFRAKFPDTFGPRAASGCSCCRNGWSETSGRPCSCWLAPSVVLLIACANVANLLLVRGHRQKTRDRDPRGLRWARPAAHRAAAADRMCCCRWSAACWAWRSAWRASEPSSPSTPATFHALARTARV